MHPAIIIGTVRSLIVDVAMGQISRSAERISSLFLFFSSLGRCIEQSIELGLTLNAPQNVFWW